MAVQHLGAVAGSHRGDAVFQGLVLDNGAATFAPPAPGKLIEFVGDSITVGTTTSQNARTAHGGGCVGLERQFTRLNPNAATPDWDPARYRADAVVINLGTNDVGHGVSATQFQAAYTSLLRKVRAAHPQAWIFALETFRGRYVPQTEAAVRTAVAGGDAWGSLVDTTGRPGSGDLTESVHPNDRGHRVVADRLAGHRRQDRRLRHTAPHEPRPVSPCGALSRCPAWRDRAGSPRPARGRHLPQIFRYAS